MDFGGLVAEAGYNACARIINDRLTYSLDSLLPKRNGFLSEVRACEDDQPQWTISVAQAGGQQGMILTYYCTALQAK